MAKVMEHYETGTQLGNYRVQRVEPLEHLQGTYYELVHEPTGARHIHIAAPDDNHTFCVLFPTVPDDSTGVAHILEHVTLSGSKRFPIKDPFFSMLPRSLKTFMNAMTSSDWTSYPFSTRNEKDFFNLLDVYLDATFFPMLDERAFRQEGHRLEFENPEDPGSGLRFKGVVFNEMKGAMASPGRLLERAVSQALLPDLTYAHNSGGDPEHIPDLTWEQLREFHSRHYHPSNAHFYTYGDLPLPRILEAIEERALSKFDRLDVEFPIPDQQRFADQKLVEATFPLAPNEDTARRSQVLCAWLTVNASDSMHTLAMHILADVLFGNPAAPLYKALMDSGLGSALADLTGFHDDYREAVFAVGLKGTDPDHADQIESIVYGTLQRLAGDGIDPAMIDAAIHQLEIRSREVSNAGYPYSLKLFFRIAGPYMYGGDPYSALRFDDDLAAIERARAQGPFFEDLVRTWLLGNHHTVRVVLKPDQQMEAQARERELQRLAAIESSLPTDDKRRIVDEALVLKRRQESREDVSVLPTLELDDVPRGHHDVEHTVDSVGPTTVGLFGQPTNGMVYLDLRTDFSRLPIRLKDLLTVFSYAATRMGAKGFDHLEMAARINAVTGGVHAAAGVRTPVQPAPGPIESLTLSGKALMRNVEAFVEILDDILSGLRFEPARLRELIGEQRIRMEQAVNQAGHNYASSLAHSKLTLTGAITERLSGLSQLQVLRRLVELDAAGMDALIADLEAIRDHLFRGPGLRVCVTAPPESLQQVRDLVAGVLESLPDASMTASGEVFPIPGRSHEARTTSAMVAYNAKVFPTPGYQHPDAPALLVAGTYLQSKFLHREVREAGGAYGAYASFSQENGAFWFGSYRDPHITRTYEAFDRAVRFVLDEPIDTQDLKEAILSACGRLDPLLSPDTKGRRRFFDDLAGYTPEVQAAFKEGVLGVTAVDLQRVADAYLTGDGATMATVCSEAKIQQANPEMDNVFEVSPV